MDIRYIKAKSLELAHLLKENNIRPDLIVLFGSQASGNARDDSDIDLAVISRDFGKDRFEEGSRLNYLASSIDHRIEAIPVGLDEYFSRNSISPVLHEITTRGIPLI